MIPLLDLFSGVGCFSLGLERSGCFQTVAFCEIEEYPRRVLAQHWPDVPIYDDVRTLSASRLAADGISVRAICGGFPCQDISYAGAGEGLDGARSGLWWEYARLIDELRPDYVLVENVAALLERGLGRVLGTLSELGYDAEWSLVSSCALGAAHMRQRLFLVAYPNGKHGWSGIWHPDAQQDRALQAERGFASARAGAKARMAHPSTLYRDADGVPNSMDRNKAIGNSIDPAIPEMIGRAILAAEAAA